MLPLSKADSKRDRVQGSPGCFKKPLTDTFPSHMPRHVVPKSSRDPQGTPKRNVMMPKVGEKIRPADVNNTHMHLKSIVAELCGLLSQRAGIFKSCSFQSLGISM